MMALVVAVTLAAPGVSRVGHAATGTVVDEGWAVAWPTGIGWQGVRLRDIPEYNESVSVLRAIPQASNGQWKSCTSISTAPCSAVPTINFSAVLQPCASATQLDCVVSFGTVDSSGNKVPATYSGAFPSTGLNDYPADASVGLPAGGPGGMWLVADSAGVPVQKHFVRAVVSGNSAPGKRVTFTNFAANVSPVEVKSFPCGETPVEQQAGCRFGDILDEPINHNGESGWSGYSDGYGRNNGRDCLMTGNLDQTTLTAECAERRALKKDVTYYLTVRMSQAVSGWLHGRMAEPSITLDDVAGSTGAVTLSVAAKPVSVPAVELFKLYADLPSSLQEKYRTNGGWPNSGGGYWGASGGGSDNVDVNDPLKRNRRSNPSPFGADSIAELEGWIPVVKDTAIADPSSWTVRTLGENDLGAARGCVTDKNKVTGIVTTNATVYKAGAPVYDSTTKSLNYTVSAPHYVSSGDLFKGAYSLIIRSDVARCIYKFTSAPIKATIEVIDTGADKNTVITTVSEANGWMKLSATGFTHSTPTIRAAFTQDEPTTATPTASTTPATASTTPATNSSTTVTKDLSVGKSASRATLLKKAGLTSTSRSRVTLAVSASSRKVCKVSGTSVRATAKGTCSVTVTVTTGSKRAKKTVKLTVG